jgi:RNA polymerase sigma factor (sigma-70 family)
MINQAQPVHCTLTSYPLASFLASLVQTNLQPILQTDDAPAPDIAPSTEQQARRPSCLTDDELTALIESIKPEIARIAWRLSQRLYSVSVDPEDLEQEGLIAAWQATTRYDASKVTNEHSLRAYCMSRARGAMLMYLRREFKKPAASLDAYLEVDTDDGSMHREIADPPVQHRQTEASERQRILTALSSLTEKERLVVMAYFRVDNIYEYCPTLGDIQKRLEMSDDAVYCARTRGLKKLARFI